MAKAKKKDRFTRVTCAMSQAQLDWIKRLCLSMSVQERRQITPSEAIRMAVETAYPLPKGTGNLF